MKIRVPKAFTEEKTNRFYGPGEYEMDAKRGKAFLEAHEGKAFKVSASDAAAPAAEGGADKTGAPAGGGSAATTGEPENK